MILILKNIAIEGPEMLGILLERQGFLLRTLDLGTVAKCPKLAKRKDHSRRENFFKKAKKNISQEPQLKEGDCFIDDFKDVDAVICLGGPMNVYEEEKYPFLQIETEFIQAILEKKNPFLGVCLGAQLLAKAAGGRVVPSPQKEIGFTDVVLTTRGEYDPLLIGCGKKLTVFQWHEDMFEIPEGAVLLATSAACPHQAVRVGPCAWGLQFHVEVTRQGIENWAQTYIKDKEARQMFFNQMPKDGRIEKDLHQTAEIIVDNFVNIIRNCHCR